jgi:hypothetical protein
MVILLFFLPALSNLRAEKVDNRNFAIDTYYPTPNEINLAETRARRYWQKNAARFGPEPVYLAVDTTKIFASEIVQDLWPKLINSQTTTSFFASSLTKQGYTLNIECIMIFDTRTGHFVSNRAAGPPTRCDRESVGSRHPFRSKRRGPSAAGTGNRPDESTPRKHPASA